MPSGPSAVEGRIPGFDNKWNKSLCDVINKEDKTRWQMQDRMVQAHAASGTVRPPYKLPRAHSCIGPFPGCRTLQELSPRKSASVALLEQRLLRSSHADPSNPTTREKLYAGVSREGEGRLGYLRERTKLPPQKRFGSTPMTSSHEIGWSPPDGEYRASRHAHHPVMEAGFFRRNGVVTYKNLPDQRKQG
mmetsp:Transcript_103478/g.299403  ORF Transcript_103478/g.299403 Transcript_103478/m.299403 type:complete len:190 (-) Transcript_103478:74-643(-)|eukprot:CAMPEP_0176056396 /NCGR_PEP_ID=MMETSP0120_2-20121206/28083_1 /TAXON_ID=160619 /ORGANISM="Kryptoperidinium foliaceum, Strain CCMP 1326" /LENGTH=189 /DNA_ID=CAMNT_0017389899 /DNA_START=65 /DNA_END=634 /DNA_ORIENTATION=-